MQRPKGKTYSPFQGRQGLRRMGMSALDIRQLEERLERKDATADQMRESHPDVVVIYGDRESFLEKRFGFLRRRRERY